MKTPTPYKQIVIVPRPVVIQLYEDEDGVWARLGKYFSNMQLSPNSASKLAALYAKENPDSDLFRPAKFADSAVPEWCVKVSDLEPFLRNRRQNVVSACLWKLYDEWNALNAPEVPVDEMQGEDPSELPLEKNSAQKQSSFGYHVSINAFGYREE